MRRQTPCQALNRTAWHAGLLPQARKRHLRQRVLPLHALLDANATMPDKCCQVRMPLGLAESPCSLHAWHPCWANVQVHSRWNARAARPEASLAVRSRTFSTRCQNAAFACTLLAFTSTLHALLSPLQPLAPVPPLPRPPTDAGLSSGLTVLRPESEPVLVGLRGLLCRRNRSPDARLPGSARRTLCGAGPTNVQRDRGDRRGDRGLL